MKNIYKGISSNRRNPEDFCSPIQEVSVHFQIKQQEAIAFLELTLVVSSPIDEFGSKNYFVETAEVDKLNTRSKPHHCLLRDLASLDAFQFKFASQIIVSDSVTKQQIILYFFSLRKFIRFNYQLIWNALDQNCFKNHSNLLTEQELLPVFKKDGSVRRKNPNLVQIKTRNFSQTEFQSILILPAITLIKFLTGILINYV